MHMDDIDRLLEIELARLLDPIVDAPAPRRRRRRDKGVLRAVAGGLSLASEVAALVVEPVQ